jgi:hypothetical protein
LAKGLRTEEGWIVCHGGASRVTEATLYAIGELKKLVELLSALGKFGSCRFLLSGVSSYEKGGYGSVFVKKTIKACDEVAYQVVMLEWPNAYR